MNQQVNPFEIFLTFCVKHHVNPVILSYSFCHVTVHSGLTMIFILYYILGSDIKLGNVARN